MAKRNATDQMTKDSWERDEDDGGRDRSEEPAEVASQAVLSKRKILKPRSRVSGASAASQSPAPTGAFGKLASTASPAPSLFGQNPATPSNNMFGASTAPTASTTGSSLFGFNTPSSTAKPPLFGAQTVQQNKTQASSLFPSSATETPNAPIPSTTPATAPISSNTSLFGNAPKPFGTFLGQSAVGDKSSTPSKSSVNSNIFGNNFGTTPKTDPPVQFGARKPTAPTPSQPLFGASKKQDEVPKSASNLSQTPNSLYPQLPNSNATNTTTSNLSNPLKSSTPVSTFTPKPSELSHQATPKISKSTFGPTTNGVTKQVIDPTSLNVPDEFKDSLSQEAMPDFNYLFQVKGLNISYIQNIEKAFKEDPFADLSGLTDFYKKEIDRFAQLRISQTKELENTMSVDNDSQATVVDKSMTDAPTPSKAAQIFSAAVSKTTTDKVSYPNITRESNSTSAPSLFSSAPIQFGNFGQAKPTPPEVKNTTDVPKSAPTSIFNFGANQKTPFAGVFGTSNTKENGSLAPPKPSPAPAFNWNSKPSSAVPSNASSPGSVLASGTGGMKDSSDGGWVNPFGASNPLFHTEASDDDEDEAEDDDDEAEEGEGADGEENIGEEEEGGEEEEETHEETATEVDPSPEIASGPFGKTASTPVFGQPLASGFNPSVNSATPNSLFSRVASSPESKFGGFGGQKTGAVGLFGNTNPAAENKTWTPEKPIVFGSPSTAKKEEGLGAIKSANPPTFGSPFAQQRSPFGQPPAANGSLFPGITSAGSGNIFGAMSSSNPINPIKASIEFSQTATSIFGNNAPTKAAAAGINFGGSSSAGLAPPAPVFGGFGAVSPSPSGISTPGETSSKTDGGDDENEPSDEAGQGNTTTKDFSGRGAGEEDEDEKFDVRSSIYNLVKGAYIKIGIGRLRVLKNRVNGRARIVVKVESGKLLMNVGLRKEMDYLKVGPSEADGKVVKIVEVLSEGGTRVWVMKVGKVEDAQKLRQTMEENK